MSTETSVPIEGEDHFKVVVSFYVPMSPDIELPEHADDLVRTELNSARMQRLIGDTIGEADVHEGETIAWDMEG